MSGRVLAIGTVLILAAFAALSASLPLESWLTGAARRLEALGPAGASLFVVAYAAAAMLLVPASVLSLVAGLVYGLPGLALSWIAIMIAASLSLPLARWVFADRIRDAIGTRRVLGVLASVAEEEGFRFILLVRLSGIVPFGVQNYAFGVLRLRPAAYLVATAFGVLPNIAVYGGGGAFGRAALAGGGADPIGLAALGAALLAALVLVIWVGRKVRARLRAAPAAQPPTPRSLR